MKRLLLLVLLSYTYLNATDYRDFPAIYLTSPKIKLVDGFPWGMDGNQYKKTMQLRLKVNQRRFGEKKENELVGMYEFENQRQSGTQLVELEKNLTANNNAQALERLAQLHGYLKSDMVEEFLRLTQSFLADAAGAKEEMVELIQDWANQAKRTDSLLLLWSSAKEGYEGDVLRTRVHTVLQFDQFCADLVYFLETLMRSCPIATQQFKEQLQKEKAKKEQ